MKKVIIFLFVVFVIKTMAQAADVNRGDTNLSQALGLDGTQAGSTSPGQKNCPEGTCNRFTNQAGRFDDTTNYTKAEGQSTPGSGINK